MKKSSKKMEFFFKKCSLLSIIFMSFYNIAASQIRDLINFKSHKAPWLRKHPYIEREVQKIIKTKKESISKSAEELFKEFPTTALLPYRLHVEELKLFKQNKADIVSVRMTIYIYTGAAHGKKEYYSWNWSKKEKRFLSLDDVINQKQFISIIEQVRQNLLNRPNQDRDWIYRGTAKKEHFKIWNLKKKGIVFVFPEYQVASYAAGSFELYVSLTIDKTCRSTKTEDFITSSI